MTFNLDEQLDALFELCFPKTKRCPNCNGFGFEFQTEVESVRCSLCQGTKQYSELDALKFLGAIGEVNAEVSQAHALTLPPRPNNNERLGDFSIMARTFSTSAKPLGYYCVVPEHLENAFGSHFENLERKEQYTLLATLANYMATHANKSSNDSYQLVDAYVDSSGQLPAQIHAVLPELEQCSDGTLIALAEALIANIHYTKEVQR